MEPKVESTILRKGKDHRAFLPKLDEWVEMMNNSQPQRCNSLSLYLYLLYYPFVEQSSLIINQP